MADFLDDKRKEIDSRLRELRPLVDEYNRLEKAAAALAGVGEGGSVSATPTRRRRGGGRKAAARPTATTRGTTKKAAKAKAKGGRKATGARRGRPRGSGTRAKQALELVRTRPGISIGELADAMGIKANYLYRVMPTLETEGQVAKRDGGWHPV